MTVTFGNTPVPWAAMWSAEAEYFVGRCEWFNQPAICQKEAQGEGTPKFGSPHVMRQRKLHALALCDICAKPLRDRTKVSMSNFNNGELEGMVLTQSEPLAHVECARLSLDLCPSLRRQTQEGRIRIRRVSRCRVKPTVATAEERLRFVPGYMGPPLLGLAVVELLRWKDVTATFK